MHYRCPFWPHTDAIWPPTVVLSMQYHSLVRVRCRVSAGPLSFAGQACRKRWSVGVTNDVKTAEGLNHYLSLSRWQQSICILISTHAAGKLGFLFVHLESTQKCGNRHCIHNNNDVAIE